MSCHQLSWASALVLCAIGPAAWAAEPTWVELDGAARVEFLSFDLAADVGVAEGTTCSTRLQISGSVVTLAQVPWDADMRISRDCDADVLAAAESLAASWRLVVKSWAPAENTYLFVVFESQAVGGLTARLQVDTYGVSPDAHPSGLQLVEELKLTRAPEPRYPKDAKKLVKQGVLEARATCRLTLQVQPDGKVASAVVDECPDPLREAAKQLGGGYRFDPRKVNGVAVAATLSVALVLRAD